MDLAGKNVVVMGLAMSGTAVVRFLSRRGANITATDLKTEADLGGPLEEIKDIRVELALGGHPDEIFLNADLVVVSPGVPRDSPPLQKALQRGIEVVSELELGFRHLDAPVLAVTGTNGKTTTVSLAGGIMKKALGEDNVFVGGNVGTPLVQACDREVPCRAAVIEVSSFQLEFAKTLKPKAAVMLNVSADHLDRYRDFRDYAETKSRIFSNQDSSDFAVINTDDPVAKNMVRNINSSLMTVSLSREPQGRGMWLSGDGLYYQGAEGKELFLETGRVPLAGRHNLVNVMAAACACFTMGAELAEARRAVESFAGLPHRTELVAEIEGVKYYNDSKATNPGAVEAAVSGMPGPLILLMGGQAKGCHFRELSERIRGKVRQVIAFGECRDQLSSEMNGLLVQKAEDMAEALSLARKTAGPGDTVLLSPGCASFDRFNDYKHRGEVFKELVKEDAHVD
ncbi:MAG: UDP-N-acetylmuramoyl-L-alanine--D-glutamate ligase [bacterium]